MGSFGKVSAEKLATCDDRLQRLFGEVVKHFDCVVLCGHRGEAEQTAAVKAGNSKTPFPKSKHNSLPSKAIDVGPFDRPEKPIDWEDTRRISMFAGFVLGVAAMMSIPIRWGGDWDQDTQVKDNTFNDLVHFEIVG